MIFKSSVSHSLTLPISLGSVRFAWLFTSLVRVSGKLKKMPDFVGITPASSLLQPAPENNLNPVHAGGLVYKLMTETAI